MPRRLNLWRHAAWILLLLLAYRGAEACSTCLCGDPTLTTMGLEKPFAGRMRLSLTALDRRESVGIEGVNQRKLYERRTTLGLSYWPGARLALGLRVPWVDKRMEEASLAEQQAAGLGDIDLDLRYYLWQDRAFTPRHLIGLQAGVRAPTAEQVESDGMPLDIDVQPGSGLWLLGAGAWYGYFDFPWMGYISAVYSSGLGHGYDDFEYGDSFKATLNLQYGITYAFAAQIGLDTRWSRRDSYGGESDEDSGGFLALATPGIIYTLAPDLLFNGSVQLPVIDRLNGDHDEGLVYRLGLTYDL